MPFSTGNVVAAAICSGVITTLPLPVSRVIGPLTAGLAYVVKACSASAVVTVGSVTAPLPVTVVLVR